MTRFYLYIARKMRCFNDITYHIYFVITQLHLGALNTKFVKKKINK